MTERAPKYVEFVEIDIPYCSLSYGEGACPAVLGVDSEDKCYNTYDTCPVRHAFDVGTVTLRFGKDASYMRETEIDFIPSIVNVQYDPAVVSLGEKSLGVRAKLSVSFRDHPYGDTGEGFDKYFDERDYDPVATGTFWGKFRARHPILRGRNIRYIQGVVGQTLEQMETRHLLVDSLEGPLDGHFSIIAKDVLKSLDGARALAPRPSNGFLIADITDSDTSATLGPAGIGDQEYPASGWVSIAGDEICEFTRSGDVLTLTRAQFNTEAKAHSAQDRIQLCIFYQAEDPADIIADLCENYGDVPSPYIPVDDWREETGAFLRRVYTALIPEPTPVKDLVSELCEQAALSLIFDDISQQIRLQVLRQISTEAAVWNDANIGDGTLRIKEQPNKRITNVITYFALRNPLESIDDPTNYRSVAVYDQTDFDIENQPTIKRIFSRWIPLGGRTVADRLNAIQAGRYAQAPRRFDFRVFMDRDPRIGVGYRVEDWPSLQLPSGAPQSVPMQITSLKRVPAWFAIEGEEVRFINLDPEDFDNRVIIIEGNDANINARTVHDNLYPALEEGNTVTFIINPGVTVYSTSTNVPALSTGVWPEWLTPRFNLLGRIQGAGGNGAPGRRPGQSGGDGQPGGDALHVVNVVEINGGEIWSGGGGGASRNGAVSVYTGGGGGGSGFIAGDGGASPGGGAQGGAPGTQEQGGEGGAASGGTSLHVGGRGGDPGQSGQNRSGGTGGAPGNAIVGASLITWLDPADIRGPQTN